MEPIKLGETGLLVGRVGLGAMPLSLAGRPDAASAERVIHAALDAGMTLIDSADVYCLDDGDLGHNERLCAGALRSWGGARDAVLIATKGGLERPGGAWVTNGRPEHLRHACERSLRALGVERIGLYQLHAPDDDVPFEESVGALAELQQAGKIAHVGLSNVGVDEIERARAITAVASVQNRCSIFERQAIAGGVVAHCAARGISFLAHSAVGGHRQQARAGRSAALRRVAEQHGVTPHQVALAWLLAQSPVMLPIPGASRVESAVSSAAAAGLHLEPPELAALDRGA